MADPKSNRLRGARRIVAAPLGDSRAASQMQVRRPIYRATVNRAAAFGSALDLFRDALARHSPSSARRP